MFKRILKSECALVYVSWVCIACFFVLFGGLALILNNVN